jgi:hypothetical protein
MRKTLLSLAAATMLTAAPAFANEGTTPVAPGSIPKFDHLFVIMMENHLRSQIIGNANAPFMTKEAAEAGQSTAYHGVAHPSLVNYLELTGGSNFGITDDDPLIWATTGTCVDNQNPGSCSSAVHAISAAGKDVATPETAPSGSCNGQISFTGAAVTQNCAVRNYASITYTPKSIAHQLVAAKLTWKDYQESLPTTGPRVNGVYYSDGNFSNLSPKAFFKDNSPTPSISQLYVTDHNPFVFFSDIEKGTTPDLTLNQVVDWDGKGGLYENLATGQVPNLSFIVPNKCHDIHTVGGQSNTCSEQDPDIRLSDAVVEKVVTAIKASPAWAKGTNAIVIPFDENDYSNNPNVVPFIVDKNYGKAGVTSTTVYDHFSLLKTMEAGFGLPCLNHACDSTSKLIDLLAK